MAADKNGQSRAHEGKRDGDWRRTVHAAEVSHSGAAAQEGGTAAGAGGVAVGRDAHENLIITGHRNVIVLDAAFFKAVFGRSPSAKELQEATAAYLAWVLGKYRYLQLKGLGVYDKVALQLGLEDLYVPLKARAEIPERDSGTPTRRTLPDALLPREDRRDIGEPGGELHPVFELSEQYDGLVILGDPGSGKTTFLKSLALRLAANPGPEPRLPVLAPISAFAKELSESNNLRVGDFLARYVHANEGPAAFAEVLDRALEQGRALVMLDGLDEVRDERLRDKVVQRVVNFYLFHRQAGNKFLLTSRIVGYRDVRQTAEGLGECTLLEFTDEDIEAFVDRWCAVLERAASGETPSAAADAQRERSELLAAIHRDPGVRELAANPLLLTILALVKRQGVELPDHRAELYEKYLDALLSSWNKARSLGDRPECDLNPADALNTLAPLALWMLRTDPGQGLIAERDLLEWLWANCRSRPGMDRKATSRRFLDDVREHSGLLLELGAGQYGFLHLTFGEYLAAVALEQEGQLDIKLTLDVLTQHVGDRAWREVTLLTVGYTGLVQKHDRRAAALVEGLLRAGGGAPGQAVVLAGDAAADVAPDGITPGAKQSVTQALLDTLADDANIAPKMRAEAGNALARLGDPRFREDAWFLPKDGLLGFLPIPAGKFFMGSTQEQVAELKRRYSSFSEWFDREGPQHSVDLPSFYMAKYPVTVAQFQAFVEDAAHEPEDSVCLRAIANHAVVRVSWHEACAYCDWLTQKLRGWEGTPSPLKRLLCEGWGVVLPSEAEWEKGARGDDARIYPWGGEPDPNCANYYDTGIGATSAVGCFPRGASPFGVLDAGGNVWEWTRSLWGKRWEESEFPYPYDPADTRRENIRASDEIARVVRGGAFFDVYGYVRCAVRYGFDPDFRYYDLGFRVVVSPFQNSGL